MYFLERECMYLYSNLIKGCFLLVQFTISQYWFRLWLDAEKAPSHCTYARHQTSMGSYMSHICLTGLTCDDKWLRIWWTIQLFFLQQEGVFHVINPNFVTAECVIMPTRITASYNSLTPYPTLSLKNILLFVDFWQKNTPFQQKS